MTADTDGFFANPQTPAERDQHPQRGDAAGFAPAPARDPKLDARADKHIARAKKSKELNQ